MTDDLVQFIRDRLDEDEQVARLAPGPSWERRDIRSDDGTFVFEEYVAVGDPDRSTVVLSDVDAEVLPFVLRHAPARVLADIEAKRRLANDMADVVGGDYIDDGEPVLAEWVLLLLALPFADHPDYRKEWRPVAG